MMIRLKRLALRGFGLLPRSVRLFVVRQSTPSYTCGTVAIIEREDGRWMFVQPAYRKGWSLPGGLLAKGESPEPAIHRELREELGLSVVLEPDPWVQVDTSLRRIDVVWRARPAPGVDPDAIGVESFELRKAGWFDPDDPPDLEDEANDVLTLRRRYVEGSGGVLLV